MPKVNNVILDDKLSILVDDYAEIHDISREQAIIELTKLGIEEVKKDVNKILNNPKYHGCH